MDGGYDEAGHAVQPEEEVLFNRAHFGSTRTDLLINHSNGLPLIVLANIMQHSPFIFLTIEKYGFNKLEQIGYDRPVSLNINTTGENRIDAEAVSALKVAGVNIEQLNNSNPSWNLADLLDGTTQLTPAYSTDEPYFISRQGEVPVSIEPRQYGIDFYGDLLFTSQHMLDESPEIVEKFRLASLKGWQFAMDHPQKVVETIVSQYKTRNADYDKEFLLFEADQMTELMSPEVIEIGYINEERWKNIALTYQSLGLINNFNLEAFLYHPPGNNLWAFYKKWLVVILIVFAISLLVIIYFYVLNRNLTKEINKRKQAEKKLTQMAELDFLTGVDNRYIFSRNMEREFDHAKRHQSGLSLLMIDIDNFKQINDKFGHLAGDEVLKSFTSLTQKVLRKIDILARYGGEEFVVILPATDLDEAVVLANRILQANFKNSVKAGQHFINYTISIGAAELGEQDQHNKDLIKRVDDMLYKAKRSGKNCVIHSLEDFSANNIDINTAS